MATIYIGVAAKVIVAPVANAGLNLSFNLPANATILSGSGSDTDGVIVGYLWEQVSGPSCTIVNPTSAVTESINMNSAGVYVFRLTVTDNDGATGQANTSRTVGALANIVIDGCMTPLGENSFKITLKASIAPLDDLTVSFTSQYTRGGTSYTGPPGSMIILAGTTTIVGNFSVTPVGSGYITASSIATMSSSPPTTGGRGISFTMCSGGAEPIYTIFNGNSVPEFPISFGYRKSGTSTFSTLNNAATVYTDYSTVDIEIPTGWENIIFELNGTDIGHYSSGIVSGIVIPSGGVLQVDT
jgi:hypothetical protein